MPPDVRFLLDENVSYRIALAFREVGLPWDAVQRHQALGKSATDEEIVAHCKERGDVWVTLDRKAKSTPHLAALLHEAKVGAFFLHSGRKQSLGLWDAFAMLVKHWPEMKRLAATENRPFSKLVKPSGIIRDFKWGR